MESPNIPPEILQALLNLAEYMEHDDKALPIDIFRLSALAAKCHAYAKALHYKELESASSEEPHLCTESLISINNKLGQPEAARGILMHARQRATKAGVRMEMEVSWFEKLGQWDDALSLYAEKLERDPTNIEFMVGRMRCLQAIQEWVSISKRRRSNVAVIHVRIVFISSFFFYCLLLNHSFQTNPNKITNCFKLFSLLTNFTNYICSMRSLF